MVSSFEDYIAGTCVEMIFIFLMAKANQMDFSVGFLWLQWLFSYSMVKTLITTGLKSAN